MTPVRREILPDGVLREWWRVDRRDLVRLGFLFEALEGGCFYSTDALDGERLLKTEVPKGMSEEWEEFLKLVKGE
jgi:hypothetical protein